MSFIDIIYTILIGPLQLVFEIIYTIANRVIGHPGLAIIVLSLIMNFLVLPLYKRSDAMQEAARDIEEKLREGVTHIKKTFSGDEQMMILQTYYRQNHYKPTDALNGSVSLLLEVPFFMAAYNFLSRLEMIQGISLGPIADLGAPDALLSIGGISVNVLPILMTLVNVISSAIYLKGFPLKTKIQLYGMALFFLVFLYTSPAGLVFYWTLNNLFSLVKTLFYKLKNPREVLSVEDVEEVQNDKKTFVLGCLFLTLLVGGLIPSTFIGSSPQEFIDVNYFMSPIWYIVKSFCLSIGTFMVWLGVFYWIASPRGKAIFDKIIWILCGIMLVNYMFFGTNLGIISSTLQYEDGLKFEGLDIGFNFLILTVLAVALYIIMNKWKQAVRSVLLTGVIALAGMSGFYIVGIQSATAEAKIIAEDLRENSPHFKLSKTGKNVIVFMLDRGMGQYIPYLFNEKPELKEQFDGFTYYSNAISYGSVTNYASPALFGGYEYTPIEMNKRDEELLMDKHNEALKVMPVLFSENGYEVSVCDVPYANYKWIPDLSIYDEYSAIDAFIAEGRFEDMTVKEYLVNSTLRNFFCFSLMKTMPLALQETLYNEGRYNQAEQAPETVVYTTQTQHSTSVSEGLSSTFMEPYNVLVNLPNITEITEDDTNTFLMMCNNTTHEPMLLQEPEYEPAPYVDNQQYDAEHMDRFTVNGMTLKMKNIKQYIHYESNMATMIQLGKWMDYMRENDVYDNTRIIFVSDHGRNLYQSDELILEEGTVEPYFPLLMVKDFNSEGFVTDDTFMTNADVPTIALKDNIENPVNPFTGKPINNEAKAGKQYISASWTWNVNVNNGYMHLPSAWWVVEDNIWEKDNWTFIEEEMVLKEEILD